MSWLSKGAGIASGCILLLASLSITADVILRWLLSAPIPGLFELSELAFAFMVAMALIYVNAARSHITMGLFASITGRTKGLNFVAALLTTIVFVIFAIVLFRHAGDKVLTGERTFLLQLQLGPFWYASATLLAIAAVAQLSVLVQDGKELFRSSSIAAELLVPILSLAALAAITIGLVLYAPQMNAITKVAIGFAILYLLALAHVPIGISMALAGLIGTYAMIGTEAMLLIGGNNLSSAMASADLASVPLFLLMGNLAVSAGFADQIFSAATSLFARIRGGHAIATIIGCAGFGAVSGSSVATTATLGGVAYREMAARNYSPGFATGSIAAGGTLGALIPPSVILIIYCVIAEQPILKAFAASLVPGLLATTLYVGAIVITLRFKPHLAPLPTDEKTVSPLTAILIAWRPILLFAWVVGGITFGIFTAQESAAAGTGVAFLFWLFSGKASVKELAVAARDAIATSAVLYTIIIGANIFGAYLSNAGVTTAVLAVIDPATTPAWLILLVLVAMYIVLGSVFDTVAAMVVTVPFVVPIIVALDYDLIWWGVITLSLVEIGMITPPIGMNVFVMKSVVGDKVPISRIFLGVTPFLVADTVRLVLLIVFPAITLWLPTVMR
ncbi:TRAP transporter large permease [Aminobacter aminovorans]|uniref:TRAP dicarboxylate transporter, DctM subunit n=1 Tax=Aminobacter aminovorans TaxID=83263 RepID=A0AAC8YWU3_AMIAI|nr:TRAP transporter large permease subunit [Aminobacter aminovorans]AMS45516.1 TRAP dicarboxylate transporter, DctM subunit [Aminobacter aminovorans]MBB3708591.1 tripartite ATP-independent transporter DctM subunit [Aminobacter aminovorans]